MDQQKITEEELNRELKGNKTTAAVCRLIGKIVAVLAFICVVTGQILLAILLIILACVLGSVKDKKGYSPYTAPWSPYIFASLVSIQP